MSIFVDALDSGFIANGGANITYSFSNDYSTWSSHEITQFESALQQWEDVANITFTPAATQASAEFVFYNTSDAEIRSALNVPANATSPLGAFELPNGTSSQQESWFNYQNTGWDWNNATGGLGQGGYGFITILHEVGHGLGLNHPHDGSPLFPGITGPSDAYSTGTNGYNQGINTVMSYNDGLVSNGLSPSSTQGYGWTGTPMAFDIAAIQEMYGVNTTFHTGDDTYILPSSNAIGTFYSSIWDAGGIDTIVAQGSANAIINLNDASLINGDVDAGGVVSASSGIYGGFTIANGAIIENATGADGNDIITGNEADNVLIGGGGSDQLFGGIGNDTIYFDIGDDLAHVLGGSGYDTLVFTSGGVPSTFGLLAHEFEAARQELTDTNGASWDTIIREYNTGWQLEKETTINDDSTYSVVAYELGAESWDTSTRSFDAAGNQTQRFITYDDNNALRYGYDTDGVGAGLQDWLQEFSDLGTTLTRYTDYDQDNNQVWDSTYNLYDAAGVRTQQYIDYDDLSSARYGYAPNGSTDWLQEFSFGSTLERYTDYDQAGTETFTSFYNLFNPAGVQTQKYIDYDNGTSGRFGYASGDIDWLQENRADGTLQYYTDWDQAGTETWEHFVNTYDTDGTTILARHFFNDDGTDFWL